jgi:hypothetical protein
MRKILIGIALIFFAITTASMAQDAQSLINKVDDNFKNRHPDWRLHSKQSAGTSTEYTWRIGKNMLQCSVGYMDSEQSAKREYENQMRGYPVGPTAKLNDLGDEAVIYKSRGEGGTIIFRKSNVVVVLVQGPLVVSEGLAKEIAGLIPNQ